MTGEEHQRTAEVLLARATDEAYDGILGIAAVTVACAQVHATLAHTAAVEEQTRLAHGVTR